MGCLHARGADRAHRALQGHQAIACVGAPPCSSQRGGETCATDNVGPTFRPSAGSDWREYSAARDAMSVCERETREGFYVRTRRGTSHGHDSAREETLRAREVKGRTVEGQGLMGEACARGRPWWMETDER